VPFNENAFKERPPRMVVVPVVDPIEARPERMLRFGSVVVAESRVSNRASVQ
jgi:hypothetical protein